VRTVLDIWMMSTAEIIQKVVHLYVKMEKLDLSKDQDLKFKNVK